MIPSLHAPGQQPLFGAKATKRQREQIERAIGRPVDERFCFAEDRSTPQTVAQREDAMRDIFTIAETLHRDGAPEEDIHIYTMIRSDSAAAWQKKFDEQYAVTDDALEANHIRHSASDLDRNDLFPLPQGSDLNPFAVGLLSGVIGKSERLIKAWRNYVLFESIIPGTKNATVQPLERIN